MTEPQTYVSLSDAEFLRESVALVEGARQRNVSLRILGSLAIYSHSVHVPECITVFRRLGRVEEGKPLFTDLDLAGYARQSRFISGLFKDLHFKSDDVVNGFFGDRRLIYYEGTGKFHVDVFLDKLEFSHDVQFGSKPAGGRLELDFPTITLADIVLEKLQIHHIGRKDLVDLIILFLGHDLRGNETPNSELIDDQYLCAVLGDDWGFWHESLQNIEKTRQLLDTFAQAGRLDPDQHARVRGRLATLTQRLNTSPKTRKWEKRARAGTSKAWYREVEEVVR
ncbi:MAG: hypothetical protein L3K14_09395 [Thermoplasmata archaeon]|nr:hypothetical protein [Thermoplasmata archaeon]